MKSVKELQALLDGKRDEMARLFDDHVVMDGDEAKYQMSPEDVLKARELQDEMTSLGKELDQAKELDLIYQNNQREIKESQRVAMDLPLPDGKKGGVEPTPARAQSLGEMFTESKAYKGRQRGRDVYAEFEDFAFKTLMETGAGFAPESTRTGKMVPYAHRRPTVADLMPNTPWGQAAVVYMEETTFTNSTDTVAEGAQYPEGALAYTERSETIRKIAQFLPVTDEQLDDVPGMRSLIDNRLTTMLKLVEEDQLMSGSGVAPDLTGFLVKSGVQSQAKGSDPVPDAIYKAMTLVRHTGFAEPSAVVFHPNDWQDIRLLRTTDGIYIWGSPAEAGPERIWGLPVVVTTAATENTALLGDFPLYSELFRRAGATIKVSDSHSDYFIKGKNAIRIDERVALVIYRAAAFCKVTGI
ncbi:MAG: phage major capsid protein [Chloroflexi bacterium]|jgi:HK97 family phage major capsid protein|nr:phage major capsid protein [Chloroflexota bacterium]